MSSDHPSKRSKHHLDDSTPRKGGGGAGGNGGPSADTRLSILEQRLHELQSFSSDAITSADNTVFVSPGVVYSDPLINLEIAILRQKEENLTSELLKLKRELGKSGAVNNETSADASKGVPSTSTSNADKKALEVKDAIIAELVRRLQREQSTVSEMRAENDNLMSQLFLLQQQQSSNIASNNYDTIESFSS